MPESKPAVWSFRLGLVCLAALSVSLPMAWISLAKVLVFVTALVVLLGHVAGRRTDPQIRQLWTPWALAMLLLFSACSLWWTSADLPSALESFIKHAKLLEVVLLVSLIRSVAEARMAITFFAYGQAFLLLSSWLMFIGIAVPWHANAPTPYVVFSTYLDQSIMFATTASVFWYLRSDKLWPQWLGIVLAALALANTLLLLEGRSGYAVALTALALAAMWTMPPRLRLATLVITPVVLLLGLSLGSAQVQERVTKILRESQEYASGQTVQMESSSGWRLNAWRRSLQAMQEKPLLGHGVGAWTPAVKRLEGSAATKVFGEGNHSNPHQEYLLWGVELGVGGSLLMLAALACMARDALRFPTNVQRATLAVVAATAVACLFNSALYDDLMGDFFCVALGLLMALGTRSMAAAQQQAPLPPRTTQSEVLV
jgi:O-antigen ligase